MLINIQKIGYNDALYFYELEDKSHNLPLFLYLLSSYDLKASFQTLSTYVMNIIFLLMQTETTPRFFPVLTSTKQKLIQDFLQHKLAILYLNEYLSNPILINDRRGLKNVYRCLITYSAFIDEDLFLQHILIISVFWFLFFCTSSQLVISFQLGSLHYRSDVHS